MQSSSGEGHGKTDLESSMWAATPPGLKKYCDAAHLIYFFCQHMVLLAERILQVLFPSSAAGLLVPHKSIKMQVFFFAVCLMNVFD